MARKQSLSLHRDFRRGNKLHQSGDIPAAAAAYQRYVGKHPQDKCGHYNLAVALAASQRFESAILEYRKAIEIDPWYPEALNNLGILFHSEGNLTAARECYARALHPTSYDDAEYNLATAEGDAANYQDAIFISPACSNEPRSGPTPGTISEKLCWRSALPPTRSRHSNSRWRCGPNIPKRNGIPASRN